MINLEQDLSVYHRKLRERRVINIVKLLFLILPNCFKLFRQKQRTSSKGERISSAKSKSSDSRTSKSDSGYSGSGLEASIATISGVDCVIEDEQPAKKSPKPSSRNDQGRSSVDSTSSSSGSSEKGKTEVNVKKIEERNEVDLKQKEAIKKQMAERKKSAGSERTGNRQAASSVRRSSEDVKKTAAGEEKRPLPSVVKSKTPKAEVCKSQCCSRGLLKDVTGWEVQTNGFYFVNVVPCSTGTHMVEQRINSEV